MSTIGFFAILVFVGILFTYIGVSLWLVKNKRNRIVCALSAIVIVLALALAWAGVLGYLG